LGKVLKTVLTVVGVAALAFATAGGSLVVGSFALTVGPIAATIPVAIGASTIAAIGSGLLLASSLIPGKKPKIDVAADQGTTLRLNKDPTAPRLVLYGKSASGGTMVYQEAVGGSKADLHVVIALAGHEIESFEAFEWAGTPITFSAGNAVGAFHDLMFLEEHLGTDDQAASAMLNAASTKWTSNHRLRGISYAVLKLVWDAEKFPQGFQNSKFTLKGRKLYDPRKDSTNGGSGTHRLTDQSTWVWSENAVLCLVDYLRGIRVNNSSPTSYDGQIIAGIGIPDGRINWASIIAEADVCDEAVTLKAGGTEPRYTCNGWINPSRSHRDNVTAILSTMAGVLVFQSGQWNVYAGTPRTTVKARTTDHMVGGLTLNVNKSSRQKVNSVRGVYPDAAKGYEAADYPPRQVAAYITEDGSQENWLDLGLPMTTSGATAQRLAKIALERGRREMTAKVTFNMTGLQDQAMDAVTLTHDPFDLNTQKFLIADWALRFTADEEGNIGLVCEETLIEEDDSIYDWVPATDEGTIPLQGKQTRVDVQTTAQNDNILNARTYLHSDRTVSNIVTIPDQAFFEMQGNRTLEFEVWFDVIDGTAQVVIGKRDPGNGVGYQLELDASTNKFRFFIDEGAPIQSMLSDAALVAGRWYHISIRRTNASNLYEMVIGGTTQTDTITSAVALGNPGDLLFLAGSFGTLEMAGRLQNVRMWSLLKSNVDILGDRFKHLNGSEADLQGYWRTDEAVGDLVANSGLQANGDGIISNLNAGVTWGGPVGDGLSDITGDAATVTIDNPGLEQGNVGWTISGSGTFTIENDPTNAFRGSYVGKFVGAGVIGNINNTRRVAVAPGDRLIETVQIKGGTVGTGHARVSWFDKNSVYLSSSVGAAVAAGGVDYAQSRVVAVAPANAVEARPDVRFTTAPTGTWYFDQVRMEAILKDGDVDALETANSPQEAGANKTETRVAASIASQGALATKSNVDLATGEVLNKTPANVGAEIVAHRGTTPPADTSRLWIDTSGTPELVKRYNSSIWVTLAPTIAAHISAETNVHRGTTAPADTTRLWLDTSVVPNVWRRHDGAAWVKATPTGALAEKNTAAWGSDLSGRPTELIDGRVAAGLDGIGDLNRNITVARANTSNVLRRTAGGLYAGSLSATLGADYLDNVTNKPLDTFNIWIDPQFELGSNIWILKDALHAAVADPLNKYRGAVEMVGDSTTNTSHLITFPVRAGQRIFCNFIMHKDSSVNVGAIFRMAFQWLDESGAFLANNYVLIDQADMSTSAWATFSGSVVAHVDAASVRVALRSVSNHTAGKFFLSQLYAGVVEGEATDNSVKVAAGVTQDQGDQTFRPFVLGAANIFLSDGDSLTYSDSWQNPPILKPGSGGKTTDTGLTDPVNQQFDMQNPTSSGADASFRLAEDAGTPTLQTETTAGESGQDFSKTKGVAAIAWNDQYTIQYDVTVGNAQGTPQEPEPTSVTIEFYYKDGAAGWILLGTVGHMNMNTTAALVLTNQTKSFFVTGVAQNDDFGISKGAEVGNPSTLVGMDNFTYFTATAPSDVSATGAGTGDITVEVSGPDAGGVS
jgi:hypothetical protein